MSPPPLKVLISGAGIGGGVFASSLLRAFGKAVDITIVERAPSLRLSGASVDIRDAAVDIIKSMGWEQQIRQCSTREQGIEFLAANGATVATMRATGRTDRQSMTSEFEIFRGDLTRIFLEPALPRVKMMFDDSVVAYRNEAEKVHVDFAKGQTDSYDLLVAADGLRSRIRGMLLDAQPSEHIRDLGAHVAFFTAKRDLLEGSRFAKYYNASNGRCIFLRPDPRGYCRAHFMNVTWESQTAERQRLNDALRDPEDYKRLLEDSFKDVGWLAPQVLEEMRNCDDFYCSMFAQTRTPRLTGNRVVLLGDAGHAVPGIGTSLAIMGGYALAGELLRHAGDVHKSLQAYEDLMLPYVKLQQNDSNMMQWANPQSRWGIGVRNTLLKLVFGTGLDRALMSTAEYLGVGEKKLQIPDYPWPSIKL